jgi:hypothetical protein
MTTIREEMLVAAQRAPAVLGESAELVRGFLRGQQHTNGGFKDRQGQRDLYYTVFGLEACVALQVELAPETSRLYLESLGDGEGLDLVHLCCLARCWRSVGGLSHRARRARLLARIEACRSADGGYGQTEGLASGSAYGCFLALGAYQDLGEHLPGPQRLLDCLNWLQTSDGVWSNIPNPFRWDRALQLHPGPASTLATAAAAAVLRHLGRPIPPGAKRWLLTQVHAKGGFLAAPQAPMPDLLSTAVALHTLAGLGVPLDHLKESCLDFLDSLWTNEGAFHGQWADSQLDCEYTFYALLALGHLAV